MESVLEETVFLGLGLGKANGSQGIWGEVRWAGGGKGGFSDQEDYEKQSRQKID